MAYVGGRLSSFFRDHGRLTALAARDITTAGGDVIHDKVVENTPIGGTSFPYEEGGGGNLRASWRRNPTRKKRWGVLGDEYHSEVYTTVEYAPFIEHGWGLWGPHHAKYLIRPKKPDGVLRWRDRETGEWVYAKYVYHPGSPGHHMMALAAAYAEATIDEIARPHLEQWARMIEKQAD